MSAEYTPSDRLCDVLTDYADDFNRPGHQRMTRWPEVEEALAAEIAAAEKRGAERGWDEGVYEAASSSLDARLCKEANPYRADQLEGDRHAE